MSTSKTKNWIEGHWSIESMELWSRDFIDEEVRGYFEFDKQNSGNFQFGYVRGQIDYRLEERDSKPSVEFTWEGNDEMDSVQGRGWMVLEGDELKGRLFFHFGDDSEIVLKHETKKKNHSPKNEDKKQPDISLNLTHAQRKVLAETLPALAGRLKTDESASRVIAFTSKEIQKIITKCQAKVPKVGGTERNSLRHIIDCATKAIEKSQGIGLIPASERLYQFKITLLGFEPLIWRRIQVKNGTLDKLHEHIQTAMGWTNSHLHQFQIDGERYGDPALLDDGLQDFRCVDSTITKISEIVPQTGKPFSFSYQYDFGDSWEHEILFEGCLHAEKGQRYPICVEGKRACPPEDVGGVWGYADFLEALADPKHEQHKDFMEWAGPFDPEKFDAKTFTKKMRRGLPNWRLME